MLSTLWPLKIESQLLSQQQTPTTVIMGDAAFIRLEYVRGNQKPLVLNSSSSHFGVGVAEAPSLCTQVTRARAQVDSGAVYVGLVHNIAAYEGTLKYLKTREMNTGWRTG